MSYEDKPGIQFGSGWEGWFTGWHPDRDLNPQFDDLPDVDKCGIILKHPAKNRPGEWCVSSILFDLSPVRKVWPNRPLWQLHSLEPLTVSPSIHCAEENDGCGAHGFIRDGRWVEA